MRAGLRAAWRGWLARRLPAQPRVRLGQRRIFILPSASGALFGLLLLAMLLAAINYQNSLAYALTFLLAALFIVAILHTYRNLAGLQLSRAGAGAVFAGEQAAFKVRLEGGGRLRQAIALGWPASPLQVLDVPGDAAIDCELALPALRRGWLRPGRMRVESRFPLGLLVAWSWVDLAQECLVYPRPLAGELPVAAGQEAEPESAGGRPGRPGVDDFQGLRAYRPGDSRQRLDWKAYSRGHGLQVKEFQGFDGAEACLDFDALEGDLESRLSRLCHWVVQLSARGQPFALRLPGQALPLDSGDGHRQACLRALALQGLPA